MNVSANALLAIGASPIMSSEPGEAEEIAGVASSLVVNIGCVEERQAEAMRIAVDKVNRLGKPWVLDPVGVGVSRMRRQVCASLAGISAPSVVRGNASEILTLLGRDCGSRGVDTAVSLDGEVERCAGELALKLGTVVSVSGPEDYITDGKRFLRVSNGSPRMTAVTATGCVASAVTGALLSVEADPLFSAAFAMAIVGLAGEKAADASDGPGSFVPAFLDALSGIDGNFMEKDLHLCEGTI